MSEAKFRRELKRIGAPRPGDLIRSEVIVNVDPINYPGIDISDSDLLKCINHKPPWVVENPLQP